MKKILLLGVIFGHSVGLFAQAQRTLLFEEFSGENCGPCAEVNPYLNDFLDQYPTDVILLKYQVNIPSAGILYYQNSSETNTRKSYYGVNSAPWGEQDGRGWITGVSNPNNVGYWIESNSYADNRLAVPSAFNLSVDHSFSADADSFFATVSISGAMDYTVSAPGKLKLRVAMIEDLSFPTPPGTNGETEFHHVMRKMYPNASGTLLSDSWTIDSSRTFTFSGAIPAYIYDKSRVRFVAFIQDDNTSGATAKEVQQAAISTEKTLENDAKVAQLMGNFYSCSVGYSPVVSLLNVGSATLTSVNLEVYVDTVLSTLYSWSGNMPVGGGQIVTIPALSGIAEGTHSIKVIANNPNGLTDLNNGNDTATNRFAIGSATPTVTPLVEGFEDGAPTSWAVETPGSLVTWKIANAGSASSKSYEFDFYETPTGITGYLYLPRIDLSGYDQAGIRFDRAYAQYDASLNDELDIEVSANCGTSWVSVWSKSGSDLATTAVTTSSYTPSASDWVADSASLSIVANSPNVLVRFKGLSAYGNNAYIDNINVYQFGNVVTGIKDMNSEFLYSVYPNPTNDKLNVDVTLENSSEVLLNVFNQLGQCVLSSDKQMTSGLNQVMINTSNLTQGAYVIQLTTGGSSSVKKFNIIR